MIKRHINCLFGFLVILATNIFCLEHRCGIDIGSGMIKAQDAIIDTKLGTIVHLGEPFFAKAALANHYLEHGEFKEDIQQEVLNAFESIIRECMARGVYNIGGVATAIFRKAGPSGQLLLKRLQDRAYQLMDGQGSVNLQIITQELEGETGFLTAAALSPEYDASNIVMGDVGNASCQVVALHNGQPIIFGGPVGNATATKMFIEQVRNTIYDAANTVNPITSQEREKFCEILLQAMTPLFANNSDYKYFQEKLSSRQTHIIAIGGHASIFAIGAKATGKTTFTVDDIDTVIDSYIGKDNNSPMIQYLDSREPETVVIKLMLLYSFMRALQIEVITYKQSAGNTIGILLSSKIWQKS